MNKIKDIIETISKTASLKEKERLLRENQDNVELFTLLKYHENPYDQFYIAKLPKKRPDAKAHDLYADNNFLRFLALLVLLKARTITGHEAQATVYDFFEKCDEDEKWLYETILLKKSMNFGTSLINKVKPKFIPEFKLMLADSKIAELDKITYPIVTQLKLDGFRAVYFPDSKTFIGRKGIAIQNKNLETYFEKLKVNDDYVLDGELYSDTLNFNQIASVLNSTDKPLDGIYYCVYDVIPKGDWKKQKSTEPYRDRWDLLYTLVRQWNIDIVRVIPGIIANNKEIIQEYYGKALEKGLEGVMLKDLKAFYKWKRVSIKSQIMMKLKPSDDYDGKIVGYEEGTGKYVGQLGKFIVTVEGIKKEVKVGGGLKDHDRVEYWKKKDEMIGQWIRFEASEVTEGNESLRFPRFKSIRDAKD